MQAENVRLKTELATMERKCKELVARMQQIHSKYKASEEENAELESALEEEEARVQAMKKEIDKEKGKVRAINDTMNKLEGKINILEDEKFLLMRRMKAARAGAQNPSHRSPPVQSPDFGQLARPIDKSRSMKIHPAGQTVTSSPKEGEQIGARIPAQDAASTASKGGNALKPPKKMLSDWKQRLRRSASNTGALKLVY
jgi:septal ring factor EnvC (AmiA/AmiB activator)